MRAASEQEAVSPRDNGLTLLHQEEARKDEKSLVDQGQPSTLYRRRWLMLVALFLLNFSNGTVRTESLVWIKYTVLVIINEYV